MKMIEIMTRMFEIFTSHLEILTPLFCALFAIYAVWYFTSAKHYAPLTLQEVKLLWKIHKKDAQCRARKWWKICHKDRIVGFKCECGYKHLHKKPIV
jgi:hypothetical protein